MTINSSNNGTSATCCGCVSLLEELVDTREELALLESRFRDHITKCQNRPWLSYEALVGMLTNGATTSHSDDHDVISSGIELEVKWSALSQQGSRTPRWTWAKVFGQSGHKKYDRLILIGEANTSCADKYADESSDLVIFDIPFDRVLDLSISGRSGKERAIQITSDPSRVKTARAAPLFFKYQVTEAELRKVYG